MVLVIAVLFSGVRMDDGPRSIQGLSVPSVPSLIKGWTTAKPGSEHVVRPHDQM